MAHGHDFTVQNDGMLKLAVDCDERHGIGMAVVNVGGRETPLVVLTKMVGDDERAVASIVFSSIVEVQMMELVLAELKKEMRERGMRGGGAILARKEVEDGRGH